MNKKKIVAGLISLAFIGSLAGSQMMTAQAATQEAKKMSTDVQLVNKIPNKFLNFIKENMNPDYETHVNPDIEIDKQPLLKESEAILSLIYRSYWMAEDEKEDFAKNDKEQLLQKEKLKREKFKDMSEIFPTSQKSSSLNTENLQANLDIEQERLQINTSANGDSLQTDANNTALIPARKGNIFTRIYHKIINLFKHNN